MKRLFGLFIRRLRAFPRANDGVITIEFAFAVSALSLLVVGIVNMGLA
ncbi:MAG: hypothetical protein VW644_01100 [Alphaproteobacteria bacterium]|jgi:Flp pilus assembly protein TadG